MTARTLGQQIGAALVILLIAAPAWAGKKPRPMTPQQRATHALNRLTFGPRPGDVQRVMEMGVDRWIEQQLNPGAIDDKPLEPRLAPLRSIRMNTAQLLQTFPPQPVLRAVRDGKAAMPTEPARKLVFQVQLAALREREQVQKQNEDKMKMGEAAAPAAAGPTPEQQEQARKLAGQIADLPRGQRVARLAEFPADELLTLRYLRGDARERLVSALTPDERETLEAVANPQGVVVNELMSAKLLRAIYSERQLQEVMTDFWFNHFNVFIYKDADSYLTTAYERDTIRPLALGKFRDLLLATATSPAMLFYLDNAQSVGPTSPLAQQAARNAARSGQQRAVPGLNENYGRELMELHTLGVTGGYTQHDVTEVAKVFTGWTVSGPQDGARFVFDARKHEPGDKTVLGHVIKQNGQQEGIEVLNLLASNPATARFIATKLARRFVSDQPPAALVDAMAQTFLASDGDIKQVLRTMFRSREFWRTDVYRAKVKTPLEFVVSAVRATGADVQNPQPLVQALGRMGMPLYQQQPPTGYSSFNSAWLNSDALVDRMNFALTLVSGKPQGVNFDANRMFARAILAGVSAKPHRVAKNAAAADLAIQTVEQVLLAGDVSPQTGKAIRTQLSDPKLAGDALQDPTRTLNLATALVLGSPEFQKR